MDDGFKSLGSSCNVQSLGAFATDTTLHLKTPITCGSSLYYSKSKSTKRKRSDIGGTQILRRSALALSLGYSSSSSDSSNISLATVSTMSSLVENNEVHSTDLNLNFQLHLGRDNNPNPKDSSAAAPKSFRTGPDLDLHLSLPVGCSASGITSIDAAPVQHQCGLEPLLMTIQEQAASSSYSWTTNGHLFPYPAKMAYFAVTRPAKPTGQVGWTFGVPNQQQQCNITAKRCEISWCTRGAEGASGLCISQDNPVQKPDLSLSESTKAGSPVASTSMVSTRRKQRNASTKNCKHPGCRKGARGASGLCIAHGGGKRCQRAECTRGAEGKTIYCKAHGGGRRCEHLGCTKSAEGRTDFCIAHGGGRRCSQEGCTRAARGKSGMCIKHGGGKRCQTENCKRSAEGRTGLCIAHGGGKRCLYPECKKGAQGSTMLCKAHGGGKRCIFPECNKGAEGSTPFCKGHGGGKRCSYSAGCPKSVHGGTKFCVAHGGGKRCASPECTKSARGKTNFCVRHGGGKRCRSDGCDRSAQGSTDFCKGHGGGKRCSWGHVGSSYGSGGLPCNRLARGKIGLCAAHTALLQDDRVHGGTVLGIATATQYPVTSMPEKMKGIAVDEDVFSDCKKLWNSPVFPPMSDLSVISEGRVHGGSLMALLASRSENIGNHFEDHFGDIGSSQHASAHNPMTKYRL